MSGFLKGLTQVFKAYLLFFKLLPGSIAKVLMFFVGLWRALRRCFRRTPRCGCCLNPSPAVYVRPDPMIYDQYYLMAQGLAVTWNNPDINLFDMQGVPVSPDGLTPDQDYEVVVTVLNGSYQAPAPGLPVYLSFLSFGIGTVSTPIGATTTNLGVKGSPQCPTHPKFTWHTPATPGHYCLQALLVWADDANPFNNLGQKNTQVGTMQSPAEFSIPVHNQAGVQRRFEIEADMYQLPVLPPCSDQPAVLPKEGRYAESRARWDEALRTQAYGMFPVTAAWKVSIHPATFDLAAYETATIAVAIEAVDHFEGVQPFNIHGFASISAGPRTLAGGVTLLAQAT